MFSLGLEFSLRKLVRVGPTAGLVAVIQCSLMIWLGYVVGRAFGWTGLESLFTGAIIAISSTTIIVKAFAEQGMREGGKQDRRLTEIVFGILIVEDLIAILLLAILTPVASGAGLSAGALALTVGKLVAFLIGMLVVGILVVPRLVRLIVRTGRSETIVVASVGICFAFALLARQFGYSVALGAFLAGALVAESGEAKAIEHLVEPVRDVFAAVFFVSVGMLIDPVLVYRALAGGAGADRGGGRWARWWRVALGAFLAGQPDQHLGAGRDEPGPDRRVLVHHRRGGPVAGGGAATSCIPVAVAVSALTTLLTPVADPARRARWPPGWTIACRTRCRPSPASTARGCRRCARPPPTAPPGRASASWSACWSSTWAAIAGIVIGASLGQWRLAAHGHPLVCRWSPGWCAGWCSAAAIALCTPFLLGAVRLARALGLALAAEALPGGPDGGGLDLAAAPRRALLVTFQLAILLVAGVPLVAVTQPFVPGIPGMAVLMLALVGCWWCRSGGAPPTCTATCGPAPR